MEHTKLEFRLFVAKFLYSFPRAVVTNYHILISLKKTQVYYLTILVVRRQNEIHWGKTEMLAGLYSLLEALGANLFSCLLKLLVATCILGL